MSREIVDAIKVLEQEKGLDAETLMAALEDDDIGMERTRFSFAREHARAKQATSLRMDLDTAKERLKGLEMAEDRFPPKMVTGWINAQKEEGRRPQAMSDQGDYTQRQLVRAYTAYQQQCEQQGLVDFAELLLRAYELFRDQAEVRAHYHRKFLQIGTIDGNHRVGAEMRSHGRGRMAGHEIEVG